MVGSSHQVLESLLKNLLTETTALYKREGVDDYDRASRDLKYNTTIKFLAQNVLMRLYEQETRARFEQAKTSQRDFAASRSRNMSVIPQSWIGLADISKFTMKPQPALSTAQDQLSSRQRTSNMTVGISRDCENDTSKSFFPSKATTMSRLQISSVATNVPPNVTSFQLQNSLPPSTKSDVPALELKRNNANFLENGASSIQAKQSSDVTSTKATINNNPLKGSGLADMDVELSIEALNELFGAPNTALSSRLTDSSTFIQHSNAPMPCPQAYLDEPARSKRTTTKESTASKATTSLIPDTSNEFSSAQIPAISMTSSVARNPLKRKREQEKQYCTKCKDHPNGFRGPHELSRHNNVQHEPIKTVFIAVDDSVDGAILKDCKHCSKRKIYGQDYNAAAHLRRSHFNKKCKTDSPEQAEKKKNHPDLPHMDELRPWLRKCVVDFRKLKGGMKAKYIDDCDDAIIEEGPALKKENHEEYTYVDGEDEDEDGHFEQGMSSPEQEPEIKEYTEEKVEHVSDRKTDVFDEGNSFDTIADGLNLEDLFPSPSMYGLNTGFQSTSQQPGFLTVPRQHLAPGIADVFRGQMTNMGINPKDLQSMPPFLGNQPFGEFGACDFGNPFFFGTSQDAATDFNNMGMGGGIVDGDFTAFEDFLKCNESQ